ncbi:MAG: hypothetical protein AMXMBFR75_03160 [Candidatus Hinthialibacteria bacterium]
MDAWTRFTFTLICVVALALMPVSALALSVADFGAVGDGQTDNTAAFSKALAQAGQNGDIVQVPAGQYVIRGTLSVPDGVTLEGIWRGQHTSQLDKGSTLLAYSGRGAEDSTPFIRLGTASCLKGVTIFYPEQKIEAIQPYPWTIQGRGQHYNVIDVVISNAFNGIDCGTFHNEGHHLRNVLMCAVRRGVYIDYTTDIGRLENVHIHNVYWWRVSAPYKPTEEQVKQLEAYTRANLEGFIIGRTDWEYISNCLVIWARIGFHFISGETGQANALITQSGSDLGPVAVKVDRVQDHAGTIFENCQFMSGFEIGPDNKGPIKLTTCGFWGKAGAGSQMVLGGKGTVTLTATHFHKWDQEGQGKACIQALDGSLILNGCEFMGEGIAAPHLLLGEELQSAVILGNRFTHGKMRIENNSQGDVQILGNVEQ